MAKSSASNTTKKTAAKKTAARKTAAPNAMVKKVADPKSVDTIKDALAAPVPKAAKPNVSTEQFIKEVKLEAQKVTWPTRKEVVITTGMVMWLVLIASIFLFVVDLSLQTGTKALITWFTQS